jgi:hypothetical protein
LATSPPSAKLTVTVSRSGSLNMLVIRTAPNPRASATEPSAPSNSPAPAADDGDTVSGHVYTESGQPVNNATVEFRSGACMDCTGVPWTTTKADGSYSIQLDPGVYAAVCALPYNCGVKGGDIKNITVPPGTTVDFIVCDSSNDYPACLNR